MWRRRMWQQPTKEEKKTLTLNLVYELPTVGRYLHKDSHYTSTLNDQVIQSEASHSRRRHFPRQPRSTTFCLSRISTLSSCRKQKRRWENVNKITMPTRNQFRFIFILFSSHITMMRCFTFYLSQFIVHWHCVVCVFLTISYAAQQARSRFSVGIRCSIAAPPRASHQRDDNETKIMSNRSRSSSRHFHSFTSTLLINSLISQNFTAYKNKKNIITKCKQITDFDRKFT